MNISIITPGAKGGYGEISKYNTNLVDYFIKKDEYNSFILKIVQIIKTQRLTIYLKKI